jgi:RhtB (resistance to homoserine/threonine) family protein
MIGIVHYPLFVTAIILLILTPGPDTAYVIGRSIAQGRGVGVMSALGVAAGCVMHTLACAFGLTALVAASATAFTVIKFTGALYLIYLGARMLFAKHVAESTDPNPSRVRLAHKSLKQIFMQGFLTNLMNPKVVLFYLSFFPQFVAADSPTKVLPFLALGATFVVLGGMWSVLLAWVAGSVTEKFSNKPGIKRWLDRVVGSAFLGLGVKLATSHR